MKTAIIYYSMSGNTKYTAEKIAESLGITDADIIRISPEKSYPDKGAKKFLWGGKSAVMGEKPKLNTYDFNTDKYQRIIIGTPVWASTFVPPIRTFIDENPDINKKQVAVFTCFSGGGADKAIEKLRKKLNIERFEAELILVDPKDNAKEDDELKIQKFCRTLA